jgi:hypothetical protein
LLKKQLPWYFIKNAKRPQSFAGRYSNQNSGIEPNIRIRSNQWIIRKTVILARIRNYRDIALPNGLLAEPAVFWIFFKSEAFFGFILFPILIDQSDHRDRYGANNKDRKDHIVKDLFGRSIEDIVFMQLPYPINIIGWTL